MGLIASVKRWHNKRTLKRGITALRNLDFLMMKRGLTRHDRRKFWVEFTKKIEVREQTFARIEKELGI